MAFILPTLPAITQYFGTTPAIAQFAMSAYFATTALVQLVIGPLSDRLGRRPVMLGALILYILGTLVGVVAPTIEVVILGRVIQGAAIAGIVLGRAIVRDQFSSAEAASRIGYITMGMAIGPMIAPAVGGILGEHFGWQSNFWAMGAIGAVALIIVYFGMGETNKSEFSSMRDQMREYPALFKSPRFWGLSLTAAFNTGAYYAFLGGGAFIALNVLHLSPTEFGVMMGTITIGYIIGNYLSGRFASRMGTNTMAIVGTIVTTLGAALPIPFLMLGVIHPLVVFAPMIIAALGNGIALPSVTAAIVSVRPRIAGTASGLGGTIQLGGASIVAVISGWAVTSFSQSYALFVVMAIVSSLAILTSLYVVVRTRQLQAEGVETE